MSILNLITLGVKDIDVIDAYRQAIRNETGRDLDISSLNKAEFDSFTIEYDSKHKRVVLTIYGFDDNDSFPEPKTIKLANSYQSVWLLI